MNTISSIPNPLLQQQLNTSLSLTQGLSASAVTDPSQFASNLMNTIQKASSISSPISASPISIASSPASGVSGTDKVSGAIDKFIQTVNEKQQEASIETNKVLTGESDNLHQSVIKMQEAGVAFSLMVEVRNQLISGFQELMRTAV